jgi:hypothetical protein
MAGKITAIRDALPAMIGRKARRFIITHYPVRRFNITPVLVKTLSTLIRVAEE